MERIVFVCDKFADKFIGGAELSIQTHIDTCPYPKLLVLASQFDPNKFNPKKDFLVFGNYAALDRKHLKTIAERFRYVIEECDYKYCSLRSSHKHKAFTGKECDCHLTSQGKDVFEFMRGADWMFWKSERQRGEYLRLFGDPFGVWDEKFLGTIVGGVFSDADLDYILSLRNEPKQDRAFLLYTTSWIKGYKNASEYCRVKGIVPFPVGNIPYRDCIKAMASCNQIVYLPNGFDVSCRMITEAKLLGLKITTNHLVQHVTEDWFKGSVEERLAFLRSRNPEFWKIVGGLYETLSRSA